MSVKSISILLLAALAACTTRPDDGGDTTDAGKVTDAGDENPADAGGTDAGGVDAGQVDAGDPGVSDDPLVTEPLCIDGFCWMWPFPQGNTLRAVWASGANDVWVGGERGTLLHFDGTSWRAVDQGDKGRYTFIRGFGPRDVWAGYDYADPGYLGPGALSRWRGRWVDYALPEDSYAPNDLAGSSPDDFWLSMHNSLAHWNGTDFDDGWEGATFTSVAVTGTGELWAATSGGPTRFAGDRPTSFSDEGDYGAIFAPPGGKAWFADRRLAKWDGRNWTGHDSCASREYGFSDVHGLSDTDIWAVEWNGGVAHWNGTQCEYTRLQGSNGLQPDLQAVFARAADDVWAVGEGGAIWHYDGTAWNEISQNTGTVTDSTEFGGGFALAADDLWLGDRWGNMRHWDGSSWSTIKTYGWITSMWFLNPNFGFAGTFGDETYHWDGTSWETVTTYSGNDIDVDRIWGTRTDAIWGVSQEGIYKWNGYRFEFVQRVDNPGLYRGVIAIDGSADNDVWAVGDAVWRYDGTAWTEKVPAEGDDKVRSGVKVFGPNDVWAVGSDGLIERWNGTTWSKVTSPVTSDLTDIVAFGTDELWVSGADGVLLRRRGTGAFQQVAKGMTNASLRLTGAGKTLYAYGRDVVLRYDAP